MLIFPVSDHFVVPQGSSLTRELTVSSLETLQKVIAQSIDRHLTYLNSFLLLSQETTISYVRVCIKDLAGMDSQHDPATVDYAVIGGK